MVEQSRQNTTNEASEAQTKTQLQTAKIESESQWTLVWREFRRRKLALFSAGLIVTLVTIGIFAPFLANDQPIVYRGVNRFAYQQAARTLRVMIGDVIEQYQEAEEKESPEEIRKRMRVIDFQAGLMSRFLHPEKGEALEKLVGRVVFLGTTPTPPDDAVEQLRELRIDLRKEFSARRTDLVSSWNWPIFASLDWLEFGFLVFILLFLSIPLWRWVLRRLVSSDRPKVRNRITAFVLVGMPLLGAFSWWMIVPDRIDRTQYKKGILAAEADEESRAPVVYEFVLWPVVPYGLDEDHLDRKYVKPALLTENPYVPEVMGESNPELGQWDQPHWLGTDGIGRDILSRMIWGARISLSVGIVAVSIYVVIGIIVGALAGYFRGVSDMLISRIIEIVICFPAFFLILTIVAFVGPSIFNIMVVIGVTRWTTVARLVRGEFLRLGEQEFVLAGRALGYSAPRLIFRHILPNAMAPVLVAATFGIAGAILIESSLSFLGFGITVPKPSWGGILSTGRDAIFRAPWLILFPGIAIFVTITAYNLVGEAFRDAADPRLRGQHLK